MEPIRGVDGNTMGLPGVTKGRNTQGGNFTDVLKNLTRQVDAQLKESDRMTQEFAVGKRADLHEIMIASEKANISFRLLLQIRNKLLEAYQEITRMQF
ncbi:MAG: flagellar hook-basal body complex protein FliE [Desulfatiglandales bacterium]